MVYDTGCVRCNETRCNNQRRGVLMLFIYIALGYTVLKWFGVFAASVECLTCGWKGKLNKHSNENALVTVGLLCLGILPGILYLCTRSKRYTCPDCEQHVFKKHRVQKPLIPKVNVEHRHSPDDVRARFERIMNPS